MPDGIDDTCIHYTSLQLMQGLTAVDLLQKQLGGKTTECLGGSLAQLKFINSDITITSTKLWLALNSCAVTECDRPQCEVKASGKKGSFHKCPAKLRPGEVCLTRYCGYVIR